MLLVRASKYRTVRINSKRDPLAGWVSCFSPALALADQTDEAKESPGCKGVKGSPWAVYSNSCHLSTPLSSSSSSITAHRLFSLLISHFSSSSLHFLLSFSSSHSHTLTSLIIFLPSLSLSLSLFKSTHFHQFYPSSLLSSFNSTSPFSIQEVLQSTSVVATVNLPSSEAVLAQQVPVLLRITHRWYSLLTPAIIQ